MNLIVDIGNTLVKLAVSDGGRIVAQRCVERLHPSMLDELLEGRRAAKAVVASTRGEADDVTEMVRPRADYLLEFTSQTPVPVANAYRTPETLGRDRLAAAVGATSALPGAQRADRRLRHGGDDRPGDGRQHVPRRVHLAGDEDPFPGAPRLHGLPAAVRPDRKRGVAGAHHPKRPSAWGVMNSLTFEIEGYMARMEKKNRRFMRNFYRRGREILCEKN